MRADKAGQAIGRTLRITSEEVPHVQRDVVHGSQQRRRAMTLTIGPTPTDGHAAARDPTRLNPTPKNTRERENAARDQILT